MILTVILIFACVSVFAYQNKQENPNLTISNVPDSQNNINNSFSENKNINTDGNATKKNLENQSNNLNTHSNSKVNQNDNAKKSSGSESNAKKIDSQSIAQSYIEEPNAVAGKPKRYNIGGKSTDVVPVIQNGEQVGEIHIDPKTGENVGGAGGAP